LARLRFGDRNSCGSPRVPGQPATMMSDCRFNAFALTLFRAQSHTQVQIP
jgi:hypothetical protein